jgi:hypothetical protein
MEAKTEQTKENDSPKVRDAALNRTDRCLGVLRFDVALLRQFVRTYCPRRYRKPTWLEVRMGMSHREYDVEMTNDRKKLTELLQQGFNYICDYEGMKVLRKERGKSRRRREFLGSYSSHHREV